MTRDEIISLAREADCVHVNLNGDRAMATERLLRFATLVAAKEREACAQVCESRSTPGTGSVAILGSAADAIRARGTP